MLILDKFPLGPCLVLRRACAHLQAVNHAMIPVATTTAKHGHACASAANAPVLSDA